jgi:hypothetical protein
MLDATRVPSRILLTLAVCLVAISAKGDVVGTPVPSLEQRFSESRVVAVARIESGESESYTAPVYRARVSDPIKGAQKGDELYFWSGNVSEGYSVGEIYLLFLNPGIPGMRRDVKVSDAHVNWRTEQTESRFPQDAPLYSAVCLGSPIPLRYRSLLDRSKAVAFVPGGCLTLPIALRAETVGARGDPFLVWVAQDPLLRFLKELNARTDLEGTLRPRASIDEQTPVRSSFEKSPLAQFLGTLQFIGLGRVEKTEFDNTRFRNTIDNSSAGDLVGKCTAIP